MSDSETDVVVLEASPPAPATQFIDSIWDDDKIETFTDNQGKSEWRCLWCDSTYQCLNATKALYHMSKYKNKKNIKACTSTLIDAAHKEQYKRLLDKHLAGQLSKAKNKVDKKRSSDEYMNSATEAFSSSKKKKTPPSTSSASKSATGTKTPNQIQTQLNFGSEEVNVDDVHNMDTHRSYQPKVSDSIEAQAEGRLTMAIADLIHSCGLPFSLASHHKFHRVLTCAKQAPKNYKPPNRNQVSGPLLDLNYDIYKNRMCQMLLKDAEVYGLSFFGDGATVKKSPLINILASSVHEPAGCLSIVDCTGHLEKDGRKDASYIANLFIPHILQMEAQAPKCTDLIIFDGASNVQKAGALLEAQLPHVSVIHGAEHVVSLFYADIFRLKEFDILKQLNQIIYSIFGSGSRHSCYAIFSKHTRDHNNGRSIGLIRASDTRMGGHIISMMRTLRLKDPLINTLSSASFIQGSFKVSYMNFPV